MLNRSQKRVLNELEILVSELGMNYKDLAESLEEDAIIPTLKSIKDHYIRGTVVQDYALIDELLGFIICQYFFYKKSPTIRQWRKKRFRDFNHYILEKLYLSQKLDLTKNIIKFDSKLESKIRRINDLRNALAHTFFIEKLRGRKRHFYDGKNIYSKEGLRRYQKDKQEIMEFLMKKAYGIDVSNYDFSKA